MTVEAEIGTVCFEGGEKWGTSQGIQEDYKLNKVRK